MKALVTGGAGFIGSHLVERLVTDGHEVTVLDNLSTGHLSNLQSVSSRIRLVKLDVADFEMIRPHFDGIDWVFHLAALADIVPSIERPLDYFHTNVRGTVAVLEASRQANVKRFIYAASSSCYGIPDLYPTPESAPMCPQYPYALTKYLGEEAAMHWARVYRLPVISLRFFNVYGPRARTSGTYGAVFGVFLAQKLHNKPLTVVGDGTQVRDFNYVTDAVEAILLAVVSKYTLEVFNVATGKPHSVNEIVELLGGERVELPKRPGEPDRTEADISKIRKMLGWKPRVAFREGVQELLKSIDYWKEAPVWTPQTIAVTTESWFKYLS